MKLRQTPCKFYQSHGKCEKNRNANHYGYCQKCGKYEPRAKVRYRNRKKDKLSKVREREWKQ